MNRPFEYKQEMDALRFTEEQKAELVKAMLSAEETEKAPVRHRRPWKRVALIASAAVLTLAVGAGAAGMMKPASEAFAGIFGFGPAETEIVDKIGRPIGASDTANGLTITADAILGDPYNVCLVYTLEAEDSELFAGLTPNEYGYLPLLFKEDDLDLNYFGGSHGSSYFVDTVPGDNAIQFVTMRSVDQPLKQGGTVKSSFKNLMVWDADHKKPISLAEGEWKMKFSLDYEDMSVTLDSGETFTQDGMNFTIDRVTLSPVAFRVEYQVDQELQWSDAPSGQMDPADQEQEDRFFKNVEILLTKTDGTVLNLSRSGGGIHPKDGVTYCDKGTLFDQLIPLEDIASFTVGGMELLAD